MHRRILSESIPASTFAAQLMCKLMDGLIDAEEVEQLEQLLTTDAQLRAEYVKQLQLHAFFRFRSGTISALRR